ncbi:MAG: hypothetical protein AB1742_11595 [bacterium]
MAKKKKPGKERLYTIQEMAVLMQTEPRELVEWVQYRKIPYVLVDKEYVRFRLSDIASWVRKIQSRRKEKFRLE